MMDRRRRAALLSVGGLVLVCTVVVSLSFLSWTTRGVLAISAAAAVAWATQLAPAAYTGVAVLAALVLAGILNFRTAFAAAADEAAWLIVAGMMLGAALQHSQLAGRLAALTVQAARLPRKDRDRGDGGGDDSGGEGQLRTRPPSNAEVARLYAAAAAVGAVAVVAIPSGVVRAFLLAPVARQVVVRAAAVFGGPHALSQRAQEGLLLSMSLSTLFPGTGILTASTPNLVVATVLETLTGVAPSWGAWAAEMALTVYVGTALLVPLVTFALFGRRLRTAPSGTVNFGRELVEPLLPAFAASNLKATSQALPADALGVLVDVGGIAADERRPLALAVNGETDRPDDIDGDESSDGAADDAVRDTRTPPTEPAEAADGIATALAAAPAPPAGTLAGSSGASSSRPLSWAEVKMLAVMTACVGLWATDSLHGIRPVEVALVAVLVVFAPYVGVAPFDIVRTEVNWTVLIYFVAIVALGTAVQSDPALADFLSSILVDWIKLGASRGVRYYLSAIIALPLNLLLESAAVAAVLTPILVTAAPAVGLEPLQVGLGIAITTNAVFFPFQSAPFLIAHTLHGDSVSLRSMILACTLVSLGILVVLLPLSILWWLGVTAAA